MTARSGRPSRGLVEKAANAAQVAHLCHCLALDRKGLKRWLHLRNSADGGLLERHARAFVDLRQTATHRRANLLEGAAPGICEITGWPWSALDASRCTRRSLLTQLEQLRRLPDPAHSLSAGPLSSTPALSRASEFANRILARKFFEALANFRLLELDNNELGMATRGRKLLARFEAALQHPAIAAAESVMLPAVYGALDTSLLVSFFSLHARIGFERRRDLRSGSPSAPVDQRAGSGD